MVHMDEPADTVCIFVTWTSIFTVVLDGFSKASSAVVGDAKSPELASDFLDSCFDDREAEDRSDTG